MNAAGWFMTLDRGIPSLTVWQSQDFAEPVGGVEAGSYVGGGHRGCGAG